MRAEALDSIGEKCWEGMHASCFLSTKENAASLKEAASRAAERLQEQAIKAPGIVGNAYTE